MTTTNHPRARRSTVVVVSLVALVALGLLAVGLRGAADPAPRLVVAEGTPDDLRALADATFATFVEAVPARRGCIGEVRLRGVRELDHRAEYRPDERAVVLRVPATAPHLEASMVHEFAHHLEAHCPGHDAARRAFLTAQGHPPGAAWTTGPSWEETPSEQWATAVVRAVLDTRDRHAGIQLSPAAVEATAEWLATG